MCHSYYSQICSMPLCTPARAFQPFRHTVFFVWIELPSHRVSDLTPALPSTPTSAPRGRPPCPGPPATPIGPSHLPPWLPPPQVPDPTLAWPPTPMLARAAELRGRPPHPSRLMPKWTRPRCQLRRRQQLASSPPLPHAPFHSEVATIKPIGSRPMAMTSWPN